MTFGTYYKTEESTQDLELSRADVAVTVGEIGPDE
jgi:hypothetical protein